MTAQRVFLTAQWKHLAMLNYAVDPALLREWVPAGTELDFHGGTAYVSLVGFLFEETRIRGVRVWFHQSFEEVNLRFYVRRGEKRGVVFLRELVPKRAVAAVARLAYREKYTRVPMRHRIGGETAEYEWRWGGEWMSLSVETAGGAGQLPGEGTLSQFITEHYWGYAAQRDGGCLEYEVAHPQWRVWDATKAAFRGDGGASYGAAMAEVLRKKPDSAFLAEGSAVTVYQGRRIG